MAFFLFLKYYGWQLLDTLTLDLDWFYRVLGYRWLKAVIRGAGILKQNFFILIDHLCQRIYNGLKYSHGSKGYFSRVMSSSQISLWVMIILALYLFMYLLV